MDINMGQETVWGFDIPKRELTEEEKNREITLDRFNEFHNKAGEDFCDTCGSFMNHLIIAGYLIAKHPKISLELLKICNDKIAGETLGLMTVYEDELGDHDNEIFYTDLAEFANLTKGLKKNINQVLIQISEYYKD